MLKRVKCELNLKFPRKIAISNFMILSLLCMPLYIHEWCSYVQVVGPPGGSSNLKKSGPQFSPLGGTPKLHILGNVSHCPLGISAPGPKSISRTVWGGRELRHYSCDCSSSSPNWARGFKPCSVEGINVF